VAVSAPTTCPAPPEWRTIALATHFNQIETTISRQPPQFPLNQTAASTAIHPVTSAKRATGQD
tara:strand:+ start:4158 stop:4346 length:189 start_codon:yes stop_codon:yes gene_type:complete